MSAPSPLIAPAHSACRALCVSVHDVAPTTWGLCRRLIVALEEVAAVPLTLLVVPDYHRQGAGTPQWYHDALEAHRARGDELALHGYAHLDDSPPPRTPLEWWRRRIMTAGEGEFAALSQSEARHRLAAGLAWFKACGWPVEGFVAPAWLLSEGAWEALKASPLRYTTTATAFHLLHPRRALASRCVAYSTRSSLRRALSLGWNDWNAHRDAFDADGPVRLALHPDDARHPKVLAQICRLLEHLLHGRMPMTKGRLAAALLAGKPALEASTCGRDVPIRGLPG